MPPKSIFRGPNAQHFQLVHRSQQDPLINDPEASQRVFKPLARANEKKSGYTLAELETSVDKASMRQNEGEAALYGITYDDSSYDYMAHLKPIGVGGVIESVLIAGPRGSTVAKGMKTTSKGKGKADEEMFELLPKEVLPSKQLMSVKEAQAREANIPEELQGLQPDMDPHLRQVLEALEDDAFVEDEEQEEDDWFGELVKGGERDDEEQEVPWEFNEWGVDDKLANAKAKAAGEETWEDRFKAFKRDQAKLPEQISELDPDELSEMADTIGSLNSNLADMMVSGGKKRRGKRGPSDASGMSMSSSSMFRNQGLRDLDDRFDKVERDYENDDDEEEYDEYEDFPDDDTVSVAPSNFSVSSRFSLASHASKSQIPDISRDDFDSIMDDFLENYEVVGRKYRPALGGTGMTGVEKLQVLRNAIDGEGEGEKEENRRRIMEIERMERMSVASGSGGKKVPREKKEKVKEGDEEKWDVETILTTYTNTENHPGTIRSRTAAEARAKAAAKAKAEAEAEAEAEAQKANANGNGNGSDDESESDSGSETERESKVTVTRPKGELAEEKKARKAAVKAERSARRAEKKSHKETFSTERKKQLASHKKLVGNGKAADMLVGQRGVVSLS